MATTTAAIGATTPTSTRPARPGACTTPSPALMSRIRRNVVLDGAKLTRPQAVVTPVVPGIYAVSMRVSGGGETRGTVATWAAHGLDGHGTVYALDANAATISQFGSGVTADPRLVVRLPGVYRSRVCSGGSGVSRGVTAPPSGRSGNTTR